MRKWCICQGSIEISSTNTDKSKSARTKVGRRMGDKPVSMEMEDEIQKTNPTDETISHITYH